jgi:type III secretion protein R
MNIFGQGGSPLWLVALAFGFSLVPMVIGISTSYLKISIVLGMLRQGLGAQTVPGNLVIMALSLGLSLLVMAPVIESCSSNLLTAMPENFKGVPTKKNFEDVAKALGPWREFLEAHSGEREIVFVKNLSKQAAAKKSGVEPEKALNKVAMSDQVVEPESQQSSDRKLSGFELLLSFLLTELKEAFSMGFVLLLPFLVIDLVVSNILVALGMFMVTPAMITLPLKLIVFVLCDGWMLLSKGLVVSYGTGAF